MLDRDATLRKLVDIQYSRNDQALGRGTFRVRGDTLEVFPAYAETAYRAVLFGDEVEALQEFDPLTGEVLKDARARGRLARHPLRHRPGDDRARGGRDPRRAGDAHQGAGGRGQAARVAPPAPAHPVRHGDAARAGLLQRDRELLAHPRRPQAGRAARTAWSTSSPTTSSASSTSPTRPCPQIGGMYEGDRSRKQTLVEYGFRLPSALDNRPADLRRVPADRAADGVRLGHPGRLRAHPLASGSSSRSCGPPGSSTPRSTCARPRTRSTT